MAKEAKKQDPQQQLEVLFNKLVKQHSEFTQPLVELPEQNSPRLVSFKVWLKAT